MPSLNEIIYNIKNIALKGKDSRTHDFSDRNIAYWAKIIRNEKGLRQKPTQDLLSERAQQMLDLLSPRK